MSTSTPANADCFFATMAAKRKAAARDEPTDEAERARRERQRELRDAALAARAAGETFLNPEKKKRKPQAARKELARKEKRRQEAAAARRAAQKEVKKQRLAAPDIVIVPIFWKGEAKQMAKVLSACADVEAALADSGKKILLDAGHKYTPGQKFAHWEHKGVKLRIEVGPREAEKGHCTVARTFVPGEPAHRATKIVISAAALGAELGRLGGMDAPGDPNADDAPTAPTGGAVDDESEDDDDGAVPAPKFAAGGGGPRRGGDDLDDDFYDASAAPAAEDEDDDDDDDESDDESDDDEPAPVLQLNKKPKKAAAKTTPAPKPAKKAKVVKF